MTTPALNLTAAKRHARRARTTGRPTRTQIDKEGLLRFGRDSSVFFSFLRTSYRDSDWGYYLREVLEGSRLKEVLDKTFREEPTT